MLRNRHSIRPSLESLESRDTPAGTVTATFTAGRLTVTGDAADNTLLVTLGWDDLLTISGDGTGTAIRLNGGPALDAVTLPAPLTGAVTINLGDGKDLVTIDTVDLPGSLTINGGNGAIGGADGNTINLRGGVLVGGNLNITNLAGADTINLAELVNIEGAFNIRNGPGGSLVAGDQLTTELRVGGLFSVSGGAGYDKVDLWDSVSVAVGSIAFNAGTDAAGSYYRIHTHHDLTVAGSVRLTAGGGEHRNYLGSGNNLAIGGAVVYQNGAGDSFNTLLSWGTLSVGQVTITNGVGWHDNTIHSYDKTVIRGGVTYSNGAGERTFNTIQGNNILSVGGNISFVNGPALQNNGIGGGDVHIGGSITVRNGNGDSSTVVTADNLLYIGAATRITSGNGKDTVSVGPGINDGDPMPAADIGPVTVNNGDGGSETAIVATRLNVLGSVTVDAGDESDQVVVASAQENGSVAGSVFLDLGAGDQQVAGVAASAGHALTIGGSLGIWAEDSTGSNQVALAGVSVRSWTEIFTGDGADEVQITASTFGDEFDLDTGAGQDMVQLESAGNITYFRGPVWVELGSGDDAVLLGGDPDSGGLVVFAGVTHWDGGAGLDGLLGRNFGAIFYGPDPDMVGYEAAV